MTAPPPWRPLVHQLISLGRRAHALLSITAMLVLFLTWARGAGTVDDRGSDSSEKAFMVILAIALGGAVTAAAVAFVASKTALFQ